MSISDRLLTLPSTQDVSPTLSCSFHKKCDQTHTLLSRKVEQIGIHSLLPLLDNLNINTADVKQHTISPHQGAKQMDGLQSTGDNSCCLALPSQIDNNYANLSKILNGKCGYPWSEILGFQSPEIIEQLTNLYQLILTKFPPSQMPLGNALMDFCFAICNQSSDHEQNGLQQSANPILGKIIYLVNKDPQLSSAHINLNAKNESLLWIETQFKNCFQELRSRLQKRFEDHKKTHLQSPEVALSVYKGREIANALLTEIGTINSGIIPDLHEIIIQNQLQSYAYETKVKNVLNVLMQSPKLRDKFSEICKPESKSAPANDILKIILGKSDQAPVTDLDAKKAALGAMLSHLRQGPAGSCFATYLAIELHTMHLEKTLDDLASLLKSGKLTRKVDGVSMDFPFIMGMSLNGLDKQVSIARNGAIGGEDSIGSFLWDAPGLKAACLALGIEDHEKSLKGSDWKTFLGGARRYKIKKGLRC